MVRLFKPMLSDNVPRKLFVDLFVPGDRLGAFPIRPDLMISSVAFEVPAVLR